MVSSTTWSQSRLARDLPGVQVGAYQPGLVVEHLLEVRHGPGDVGGVAGEAAPDVVVDPARGHRPQGGGGHGERRLVAGDTVVAKAQLHQLRLGELRGGPEPSPGGVEARRELGHGGRQQRGGPGAGIGVAARAAPAGPGAGGCGARSLRPARRPGGPPRRDGCATRRPRRRAPDGSWACRGRRAGGSRCPPKNGRPSGVRNTVMGHPPLPVMAWTASM